MNDSTLIHLATVVVQECLFYRIAAGKVNAIELVPTEKIDLAQQKLRKGARVFFSVVCDTETGQLALTAEVLKIVLRVDDLTAEWHYLATLGEVKRQDE